MRNAIAVPFGETAVLVTMRRGALGPWSVLTDVAAAGRESVGPPPGYLALVGIGSCTIVTVAGVASRGASELLGMRVAFDVEPADDGDFAIRQRTSLEGDLSERDYLRLSRAAAHCPVGKDFTKRGLAIEDSVALIGAGRPGSGADVASLPDAVNLQVFAAGSVEAEYLTETREWGEVDGRRILEQEGEVKVHVDCAGNGTGARRWGFLGGHSTEGWAPRPSSYAQASLAASTLMTLRSLADELHIDPATLRVEVRALSAPPAGGKTESQDAAAMGVAQQVRWLRAVEATATSGAASNESVARAMRLDPIFGYSVRGDLLAGDEVTVVPPDPGERDVVAHV